MRPPVWAASPLLYPTEVVTGNWMDGVRAAMDAWTPGSAETGAVVKYVAVRKTRWEELTIKRAEVMHGVFPFFPAMKLPGPRADAWWRFHFHGIEYGPVYPSSTEATYRVEAMARELGLT